MFVTKQGLADAQRRLVEMQRRVSCAAVETAEMYYNAGDTWHDNPGWYAAQQQQKVLEAQLAHLRRLLESNVEFIEDLPCQANVATVGSVVLIRDDVEDLEITILGPLEVNPVENVVSYDTPIAQAMIGKTLGDHVRVDTGYQFRIVSIRNWQQLNNITLARP